MAYGHSTLFFVDAAAAAAYLASCRASSNYTAENYQDRVAAQNCLRRAAGWSPVPLPKPSRAAAPVTAKKPLARAARARRS
jgi:hypothetical protein